MTVESQLGFDNAYNRRLRELNRQLENMDVITHNPQLLGGGRVQKYVSPGNNGQVAPVEQLAFVSPRLAVEQVSGGRQRKTGLAKALRTIGRAVKPLGKTLKPVKKAAVERAVRELEMDMAPSEEMPMQAGKISRSRKAKKWTDFGEDVAYRTLAVANAAKSLGGKVSRMKKAEKWRDFGENTAYRALAVANAAKSLGGAKPRAPSARNAIVKKVMMERGVSMIQASKIVKSEGLY